MPRLLRFCPRDLVAAAAASRYVRQHGSWFGQIEDRVISVEVGLSTLDGDLNVGGQHRIERLAIVANRLLRGCRMD